MRKTTVDELAVEAGISKGAFYKFYQSKEHLFLDMLEQWYQSISQGAMQALAENAGLSPRARAAAVLKASWRIMRKQPLVRFCQEECQLMIRKLPETLLREHYLSVDEFITSLIARSSVSLRVTQQEACAGIKILFLALLTEAEVGECFDQALDALVDGACLQMIREE